MPLTYKGGLAGRDSGNVLTEVQGIRPITLVFGTEYCLNRAFQYKAFP
jgi:hypothetical protein